MKLYLDCMQCTMESQGEVKNKIEVEYKEEGCYYFECPNGHKNYVVLQEHKFETLFQIGSHAIYDGYYREAVTSFTSSLERFYEFCVQVFCCKYNVSVEKMQDCEKFYTHSSERQFGSFLFLYLVEFQDIPFTKKEYDDSREFRNEVIHNGKIPTREEALAYGDYVRKLIITIIIKLKKRFSLEIQEITRRNMQTKMKQNKYNCNITTMCNANIISLVNGNLEKDLKEDFISLIKSMKRLEYGMSVH